MVRIHRGRYGGQVSHTLGDIGEDEHEGHHGDRESQCGEKLGRKWLPAACISSRNEHMLVQPTIDFGDTQSKKYPVDSQIDAIDNTASHLP